MKTSQNVQDKFKQLVETYRVIIDECTDSKTNDCVLDGKLDVYGTLNIQLYPLPES